MLAKFFGRLMKNDKFKKKFIERLRKVLREVLPKCFECSSFGHLRVDCGNFKQAKGKAYNATLSESEEEETPDKDQKFLAFVAPHEESEGSQLL
jgi:hypothetical protein